jgi:hypothetical protein
MKSCMIKTSAVKYFTFIILVDFQPLIAHKVRLSPVVMTAIFVSGTEIDKSPIFFTTFLFA